MLDQTTLHNRELIARLQKLIEDDGFEMPRKKKAIKREVEEEKQEAPRILQDTCTCKIEIRNGQKWKIVSLECFDHGLFSNRPNQYHARDYNLSRHPYAE